MVWPVRTLFLSPPGFVLLLPRPLLPAHANAHAFCLVRVVSYRLGRHVLCMTSYLLRLLPTMGAVEPKADGRAKKPTYSAADCPVRPNPHLQLCFFAVAIIICFASVARSYESSCLVAVGT
jgi:hypothetical protein